MKMFKKNSKGFTLIELLVVIAIIGILSSVVLASLNSARKKSRDARRVADIKRLQLALELYFDSNKKYPAGGFSALSSSLVPTYLPAMSNDPLGGSNTYKYCADSATALRQHTTLRLHWKKAPTRLSTAIRMLMLLLAHPEILLTALPLLFTM